MAHDNCTASLLPLSTQLGRTTIRTTRPHNYRSIDRTTISFNFLLAAQLSHNLTYLTTSIHNVTYLTYDTTSTHNVTYCAIIALPYYFNPWYNLYDLPHDLNSKRHLLHDMEEVTLRSQGVILQRSERWHYRGWIVHIMEVGHVREYTIVTLYLKTTVKPSQEP